ncbi:MAG: hypothetical protein L0Z62_50775 [Gemmataceae bacterium]|nr:hypothetical protein [Gemmataceae bacterium]
MRRIVSLMGLGVLFLAAGQAQGQVMQSSTHGRQYVAPAHPPGWQQCPPPPHAIPHGIPQHVPPMPEPEKEPAKKPVKEPTKEPIKEPTPTPPTPPADVSPPTTDAFSQAPPAGGAETGGFNPAMFGDLPGGPNMNILVRLPNGATVAATAPVIGRGAFKIAENESPRPTDRIFYFYNYYDSVNTSTAAFANAPFNLNRHTIGFEKTFFDGDASLGMRMPFLQLTGNTLGLDDNQIGDLSIIFKWAFLNNRDTGNVMSAGMVLTVPTGDPFITIAGEELQSTLLQPYFGYIYNAGNFYVQGFTSLVIPTQRIDVTLMLNDIGFGYRMLTDDPDAFFRGVVPTIEAHLITPLSHRSSSDPFHVSDYLSLTGGVNLVFGRAGSTLGLAMGVPVTGPRPYDVEAIGSLNIRF